MLRARDYEIIAISCLDIPKEARGASNRGAHRVVQVGRTQGCASGALSLTLFLWILVENILFVRTIFKVLHERKMENAPHLKLIPVSAPSGSNTHIHTS